MNSLKFFCWAVCWAAGGQVVSAFKSRCMRSCRPLSWGCAGRLKTGSTPSCINRTLLVENDPFGEPHAALHGGDARVGGTEGGAVVALHRHRQTMLPEHLLDHRPGLRQTRRGERRAGQQISAHAVDDGQRIAVLSVEHSELTLVIDGRQLRWLARR